MQKWSLESFDAEPTVNRSAVVPAAGFEASRSPAVGILGDEARLFRHESGFSDTKALMNSLTREERAQVYKLVELDLVDEYRAREAEIVAAHEAALVALAAEQKQLLADWTGRVAAAVNRELQDAAAAAARLTVQLAEKIVRREVATDPGVLGRVIETTLLKIAENTPLSVRANPVDAAWLEGNAELLARLNIGQIVADRRLEAGGCVIQCRGREWDAGLERQMGTLQEIVDATIATGDGAAAPLPVLGTADESTAPSAPETDDAPGLA
jgi:flagellar biosynthesis/type III secretory pathway protein FliH